MFWKEFLRFVILWLKKRLVLEVVFLLESLGVLEVEVLVVAVVRDDNLKFCSGILTVRMV